MAKNYKKTKSNKPRNIKDKYGNIVTNECEVNNRWNECFKNLLNVDLPNNQNIIDNMNE